MPNGMRDSSRVGPSDRTPPLSRPIRIEFQRTRGPSRIQWRKSSAPDPHRVKKDFLIFITERVKLLRQSLAAAPHPFFFGLDKVELQKNLLAYQNALLSKIYTKGQPKFASNIQSQQSRGKVRTLDQALFNVELKNDFIHYLQERTGMVIDEELLRTLADCQYPDTWFPLARAKKRKLHLHVGPTNSGKTYHALKHLQKADVGAYAGPLRLLAYEVFSKFQSIDRPCNLITGDDRRMFGPINESISSCTVEMLPLHANFEVAIIDEVQMLANDQRGNAWTHALLGISADVIHLCGEERSVSIVEKVAALLGEELQIHRYERLNPLKVTDTLIDRDLSGIQKGDCLVCFDRLTIRTKQKQIEKATGRRCAIIYGGLPPLIRIRQAQLFNDDNNDFDFLVATDAIGMGLNLQIKRIIFSQVHSHTSEGRQESLATPHLRQIAGRAGRYQAIDHEKADNKSEPMPNKDVATTETVGVRPLAPQAPGLIAAHSEFDLQYIRQSIRDKVPPIESMALEPTSTMIQRFASQFPAEVPFSCIFFQFFQMAKYHSSGIFAPPDIKGPLWVLSLLDNVSGLTISQRLSFSVAPAKAKSGTVPYLMKLGEIVSGASRKDLLDLREIDLELLDKKENYPVDYQEQIERLHSNLELYIWLSYRFPAKLKSKAVAERARNIVEERINNLIAMTKEEAEEEAEEHTRENSAGPLKMQLM
ncbi:MAG: RNA helicase [Vezdaea aestivalis]|nr:MAG: RNA helicase [Vezdaea aestivalis]